MTERLDITGSNTGRIACCESIPFSKTLSIEPASNHFESLVVTVVTQTPAVESFLWRLSSSEKKGTLRLPNANLYPLRQIQLPSEFTNISLSNPCLRGPFLCVRIASWMDSKELLLDGLRPKLRISDSESVYLLPHTDLKGNRWMRQMVITEKGEFGGLSLPEQEHKFPRVEPFERPDILENTSLSIHSSRVYTTEGQATS